MFQRILKKMRYNRRDGMHPQTQYDKLCENRENYDKYASKQKKTTPA